MHLIVVCERRDPLCRGNPWGELYYPFSVQFSIIPLKWKVKEKSLKLSFCYKIQKS